MLIPIPKPAPWCLPICPCSCSVTYIRSTLAHQALSCCPPSSSGIAAPQETTRIPYRTGAGLQPAMPPCHCSTQPVKLTISSCHMLPSSLINMSTRSSMWAIQLNMWVCHECRLLPAGAGPQHWRQQFLSKKTEGRPELCRDPACRLSGMAGRAS